MKLKIDTSVSTHTKVELIGKERTIKKEHISDTPQADVALKLINELLNEYSLETSEITEIEVVEGPGSFTGIRIGVAIANALSFSLGVPVNKKQTGRLAEPVYE